jgi:tRNA-2-methylthio-N6-dimethylallyladenosine synthase
MVRQTGICSEKQINQTEVFQDPLFQKIPGLDFVFRIEDTAKLEQMLPILFPDQESTQFFKNYTSYFKINPRGASLAQAYVPIMQGCNNFCSYCIVPYARGREKCRPLSEIIQEITDLAGRGMKEVTLLGQNVNSFKLDPVAEKTFKLERELGKSDFVILLQEVNKIPKIKRVRYTSSHPKDFDLDLIEAHAKLENLCPHVHLALQSGDDQILSKMNRHYTGHDFSKKIQALRQKVPEIAVTTDIIVGFCGETDVQFQHTLQIVRELQFDVIYLAQYSPRSGTYAAENLEDNVPYQVKHQRWHELNQLLKKISLAKNESYLGKPVEVLIEEQTDRYYSGKTPDWKQVQIAAEKNNRKLLGEIMPVWINEANVWALKGEFLS